MRAMQKNAREEGMIYRDPTISRSCASIERYAMSNGISEDTVTRFKALQKKRQGLSGPG
jgi:hypothetical protein